MDGATWGTGVNRRRCDLGARITTHQRKIIRQFEKIAVDSACTNTKASFLVCSCLDFDIFHPNYLPPPAYCRGRYAGDLSRDHPAADWLRAAIFGRPERASFLL